MLAARSVDLGDGIEGSLRASELARGRVEDARTVIKVGEEIEAKFTNVDRKNRRSQLVDQGQGSPRGAGGRQQLQV